MRIVVMGATSGLGRALAERFINHGWTVGAAGRNEQALDSLKSLAPDRVHTARIDILSSEAPEALESLIQKCGGMDIYLHCSGIALLGEGYSIDAEVRISDTNVVGFTRMVSAAYRYFAETRRKGRLVAVSSIAGVRGLESMPAYSASKAFDTTLLEALRQRAHGERLPLSVVDIRPGWTRTPLLAPDKRYMWEMDAGKVTALAYRAVLGARRSATIGWRWRILTKIERLVPAAIWQRLHVTLWK